MNKHLLSMVTITISGVISLAACQSQPASVPTGVIPTETQPAAMPIATPAETQMPSDSDQQYIIFDDDGSPDGTSALLYFLANPQAYVISASISFGEAYPAVYIQHIGRVLDAFGITDIPLGAGHSSPLSGSNYFPDWIHDAAGSFWGLPLPNTDKTYPVSDGARLIVSTIRKSAQPVTVFVSGPYTNLAQALRLDPQIKDNIQAVYIMGGAIYVRGNIADLLADTGNTTAEWNVYADPLAAKEVFESGLDIYLVPLDATNQVRIDSTDIAEWRKGGEISDLAAQIYDTLMSSTGNNDFMVWDLMTAAITVNPDLCPFERLGLSVVVDSGLNSGQVVIEEDSPAQINVCLEPNINAIKLNLLDTFSQN